MKDDLVSKMVGVLDDLFKPENMADNYQLQNLLAKQQFIKIDDLPSFSAVADVTEKREIILEAVKLIPSRVTLNEKEDFLLPKIPHHRTTLILRDLPEDATPEEVKELLMNKECGRVKEIHPDVNKTWFVTFANEEECVKTALWVQTKAKFRGQNVRCRIKSEHNQKSFFNAQRFVPPASGSNRPRKQQLKGNFPDPAVLYYGPPEGNQNRMNYPPPPIMDDFAVSDPDFLQFVNQQLRGPTYEERSKKPKAKAKAKKSVHKKIQEAPRNYDEKVDYDGIFKLVNKQTFELVINRYMDNVPEGPQPPPELLKHSLLKTKQPHFEFIAAQEDET